MSSGAEKRKSVRVPVELPVKLQKMNQTVEGTVLNCSIDGMFIKTAGDFPVNEIVTLTFSLPPAGSSIAVRSRTIWSHAVEGPSSPVVGLGIRFEHLSAEQQETLQKFINQILNS